MWQDMKSQIIYNQEKFGISDVLSPDILDTFLNSDVRECPSKVKIRLTNKVTIERAIR